MLPDEPLIDEILPEEPTAGNPPSPADSARFGTGQLVATPMALSILVSLTVSPWSLLDRHVRGDWGDLDEHDRRENERALLEENRLLSAYTLPDGTRLWIITEADRSATTLLLPDEY